MHQFIISKNRYLNRNIEAYFHQDYTTFGTEGNPDFINHLKNQFGSTDINLLRNSMNELVEILKEDLPKIREIHGDLTVCVIPRSKRDRHYSKNQKLFKATVSSVVDGLNGFINGSNFITRHTDTRTTHMNNSGHGGDGPMPYVGITNDTCTILDSVIGRNILLIDDIYTLGVNVDEDALQALIDKGARNIYFYSIGKTYKGGPRAT